MTSAREHSLAMSGGVNMRSNEKHIAHRRLGVRGLGVIVGCLALFGTVAITAAPAGATAPVLDTSGTSLTLGGVPQTFTGYVAYSLATDWGVNRGCGGMFSDDAMNSFFASLPPNSLVRFDAFQGALGVNTTTGAIDFTGLDRVFAAAEANNVTLIPVLANQWGGCDDGRYKDLTWYQRAYAQVPSASLAATAGLPALPLSYKAWVTAVVSRYSSSPALGMWEPVGEAEAGTCPTDYLSNSCAGHTSCPNQTTAETALYNFFTTIGTQIRQIDPQHLIEDGLLGGGQCGTGGSNYQKVAASSGIDVTSVHDYHGSSSFGGDVYNGVSVRLKQANAINKPLITGESGLTAQSDGSSGCISTTDRAPLLESKAAAQLAAGVDAFVVWNFEPNPIPGCSYAVLAGDPLIAGLHT